MSATFTAAQFHSLFAGLERAHGIYRIPDTKPNGDGVKVNGRGTTDAGPATVEMWNLHLHGRIHLGVVPIREDGTCVWGAIDVDEYGIDLPALARRIAAAKLPLTVVRTKSGGAHLALFLTGPAPAALIQGKLAAWAAWLGWPGVEVFPKQTEIVGDDAFGNWLNMPYQNGDVSLRYAHDDAGAAIGVAAFLERAAVTAVAPDALAGIEPVVAPGPVSDVLDGGPPCLQVIARIGLHGDLNNRNRGMLNFATFLKKKYPDEWEPRLLELNQTVCHPPLEDRELRGTVIKSTRKKNYRYQCKTDPLHAHCDSGTCVTRPFGITDGKGKDDWERNRGVIVGSLRNVKRAMDLLGVRARHDAFADRSLVTVGDEPEMYLDDAAVNRLWLRIEEEFGFRPGYDFFCKVLSDFARQDSFHPVRDYLDGLVWDGVKRIDTWLFDYGGVPGKTDDSDVARYVRAVGRITLVAAVRRVRQPGAKFDEMLVLVTEKQGLDKSTALETLAVRPEWFTDSIDLGARDKEAIEQLAGKWIVEIGELRGRRKNDIDRIKTFLSRGRDRARLAYGRMTTEMPRHCVFFGSTNDVKFLKDRTGNRRFWPVFGARFDVDHLRKDIGQLWAEAAAAEATGESIRLAKDLWDTAATIQGESLEEDPWTEVLDDALNPNGVAITGKIQASSVWKILGVDTKFRTPDGDTRMGTIMRELGWERTKRRFGGPTVNCYVRGDAAEQMRVIEVMVDPDLREATVIYADDPPI